MHIHHVAIWTADLEGLADFYVRYFNGRAGPKYTNEKKGYQSIFVSFEDGASLELMQMPGIPLTKNDPLQQFTGLIHLSLAAGSVAAVDALTARLEHDGLRVVGQPRRTGDGFYESVVLDPDGNRIEICA
jgi:lactoylglutathione lyase